MKRSTAVLFAVLLVIAPGLAHAAGTVRVPLSHEAQDINDDMTYHRYQGKYTLSGTEYHLDMAMLERGGQEGMRGLGVYLTADPNEGYRDTQPVPDVVGLGRELFTVKLDHETSALELTPFEGETGKVKVSLDVERLSLEPPGEEGIRVLLYRPGKEAEVPTGTYRLNQYQMVAAEDSGQRWYVCAMGTEDSPLLEVKAGESAELTIGGPYVPQAAVSEVQIDRFWNSVPGMRLDFVLHGVYRENASQYFPIKSDTPRKPPKFTIRNAADEVLEQGKFEYG